MEGANIFNKRVDVTFMAIYLEQFCTLYYGQGYYLQVTQKLTATYRYFSFRLWQYRQGERPESLDSNVSYLNGSGRWNKQMS
jgi:hypothetical protein